MRLASESSVPRGGRPDGLFGVVRNVHVRELPVPASQVGALLDGLGRTGDRLWPAPGWPAMRLAGPPAVGVTGRHGPIRYRVSGYEPGRRIEYTFAPGVGVHGFHAFDVEITGPSRCVLRHTVAGRLHGSMRLVWPAVMAWLHDAAVEDLLDRAEAAFGVGPARPARWSPWVRVLRLPTRQPLPLVPSDH